MLFSKIIVVNGINKFQFFTRYRYIYTSLIPGPFRNEANIYTFSSLSVAAFKTLAISPDFQWKLDTHYPFLRGLHLILLSLQAVGLVSQARLVMFRSADHFQYSYPISDRHCSCRRNGKGRAHATNLSFEKVVSFP